jgi:hypothetical protein
MKPYRNNNIARKKSSTGISHVVFGQESKTCPADLKKDNLRFNLPRKE